MGESKCICVYIYICIYIYVYIYIYIYICIYTYISIYKPSKVGILRHQVMSFHPERLEFDHQRWEDQIHGLGDPYSLQAII